MTLLVPYFIYNVMAFIYNILYDVLKYQSVGGVVSYLMPKSIIEQVVFKGANPPMWFIPVLFGMVVLYPLIWKIVKNKWIGLISVSLIIVINLAIGVDNGYSTIRYWMPEYIMGALVGYHFKNQILETEHVITQRKGYLYLLCILAIVIYCASLNKNVYYLYRLVAPIIFYLLIDAINFSKPPQWIFGCSFFIFGTHIMFIAPMAKVYYGLVGYGMLQGILANIVLPALNILSILVFAYILRKVFPTYWKLCMGGRSC